MQIQSDWHLNQRSTQTLETISSHQFSSPRRRRTIVWLFQSETGFKKQRKAPSRPNVIPFVRAMRLCCCQNKNRQKMPEVFGQISDSHLIPYHWSHAILSQVTLSQKPQWLFASTQSLPWTSHCALSWKLRTIVPCSMITRCNGCSWQCNQTRTFEIAGKELKSVSANLTVGHTP